MYYLYNGHNYIGVDSDNVATSVSDIAKAYPFPNEKKAENYKNNLRTTLRKFGWRVVKIDEESKKSEEDAETVGEYIYVETELEKSGFDISKFFSEAVKTISQLRDYAQNMEFLEHEYDKKILDARHYKRDKRTKLSAIQLQRLEQFEISLERERYECKSNRIIAEVFLKDLTRLENPEYISVVSNVKDSEYNPKVLTYELLDEIVGKKVKK